MKLVYDFTEDEFVNLCVNNVRRNGTTIFQDIYEALSHFLSLPADPKKIIDQIKHSYKYEYFDKNLALNEYNENGFIEFYYPSMEVYSSIENPLNIKEVILPRFIKQLGIEYGDGVIRKIKVKRHNLKTKNRTTVELIYLRIDNRIINKIQNQSSPDNIELLPSHLNVWEWRQTFYNKVSGKVYFCQCFENAIKKEGFKENKNDHPHIKKAINEYSFKESICHLCRNTNSDLFYCHPMYGSAFKVKYGAYIKKVEIDQGLDGREAENIVREMKGVAKFGERWVNETLLFNYIDVIFPHFAVNREASPPWLSNQRLDIFIPEINLAIEYQGEQHFKPVDLFGGKEGLRRTRGRDKEKLAKCKNNKVDLVYFTYKDDLTEKLVCKRLKKYLDDEKVMCQ